jgi:hypothetical protein
VKRLSTISEGTTEGVGKQQLGENTEKCVRNTKKFKKRHAKMLEVLRKYNIKT